MNIVRFVFPFLFVRNWYNGAWEFSMIRFTLFLALLLLIALGLLIVSILQAPVTYESAL